MADVADLISEPAEIEISEIIAVEIYSSLAGIVESHNQLEDGRFSAARLADQSGAIQIELYRYVVQNFPGGVFGVRKADILQFDVALAFIWFETIFRTFDGGLSIKNFEYSSCSFHSFPYFLQGRRKLAQVKTCDKNTEENSDCGSRGVPSSADALFAYAGSLYAVRAEPVAQRVEQKHGS